MPRISFGAGPFRVYGDRSTYAQARRNIRIEQAQARMEAAAKARAQTPRSTFEAVGVMMIAMMAGLVLTAFVIQLVVSIVMHP